jgi:NCAIR mutase (PurE)-related protein
MEEKALRRMLEDLAAGKANVDEAMKKLRLLPFEDLGYAKIDHHRAIRCGFPEVIFCLGKTKGQIVGIAERIVASGQNVLATRVSNEAMASLVEMFPMAHANELARTVVITQNPPATPPGLIAVVCAGTSDLPVAEEARVTAEAMGSRTTSLHDVGVAGIHRLLGHTGQLQEANVIIVVAGMEGALASVVGGLVDKPVIAVPTSIGYGASFGGIAPLLTMLNSCAAGISVVNIDNGFGAGYVAALINRIGGASAAGEGSSSGEKSCS